MFTKDMKSIAPVTREDIQYVAGYCQKKLNGQMAKEEYGERIPPFQRNSQGLGLNFALQHKERLINNGYTFLAKQKVGIPRYFRDKFGVTAAELMDNTENMTVEKLDKEANALWNMFEEEMKRKGTWYPDNLTMQSIRFERWMNDFGYSLARQVEKDFHQLQKIRGQL